MLHSTCTEYMVDSAKLGVRVAGKAAGRHADFYFAL